MMSHKLLYDINNSEPEEKEKITCTGWGVYLVADASPRQAGGPANLSLRFQNISVL